MSLESPVVYVVMWHGAEAPMQCQQVPDMDTAHELVLVLRSKGYTAGWERIDPLKGDMGEGMM